MMMVDEKRWIRPKKTGNKNSSLMSMGVVRAECCVPLKGAASSVYFYRRRRVPEGDPVLPQKGERGYPRADIAAARCVAPERRRAPQRRYTAFGTAPRLAKPRAALSALSARLRGTTPRCLVAATRCRSAAPRRASLSLRSSSPRLATLSAAPPHATLSAVPSHVAVHRALLSRRRASAHCAVVSPPRHPAQRAVPPLA